MPWLVLDVGVEMWYFRARIKCLSLLRLKNNMFFMGQMLVKSPYLVLTGNRIILKE